MKTIKNQIGKMALVLLVILSMVSCTKEDVKNPYPTPVSGSYNIKENDTSGIANLMTEAEIVDLLSVAAPVDGIYKTGRIIAENSIPRLDMQYLIDSSEVVKLSIPLINEKGYLTLTKKGKLTTSSGTVLSEPTIPTSNSTRRGGHITLMR